MLAVMGIWSWFGLEHRSETPPEQPAPGSGVRPPSREQTSFTVDSAVSLSTVYRAISILATGASQLTLDVWRGEELLEKPGVVRKPDINSSLSGFLEMNVTSLSSTGNCFWKLTRNARNEVTNIEVLDYWKCSLDADKKILSVGDEKLTKDKYHHLQLLRMPGSTKGLGPIQACRAELVGVHTMRDYASDWFTSGDVPSGILKSDQLLTPAQAEQYKQGWQARAAHEVAVLGSGLDYHPILLSPKDAQFIENQQFSTTAVARLFGIPAHLLLASVEGGSMTYQNIAQADLSFIRWTLMKYLREIEEAFSTLLPGMQTARFNLDALLRPDTKSRYEAHQIGLSGGFLTVNDVRRLEGLPPLAGGDVLATPAPAIEAPPKETA